MTPEERDKIAEMHRMIVNIDRMLDGKTVPQVLTELTRLREENRRAWSEYRAMSDSEFSLRNQLGTYKDLLDGQVDATNVVTKELNAMYAELGIYRHPSEPDRGPDAIKRLRGAVEWACDELSIPSDPTDEYVEEKCNEAVDSYCKYLSAELRRRTGGG